MEKSFIDVAQNFLRMGLSIPVKTKNPLSRTILPLAGPPFGFEIHERLVLPLRRSSTFAPEFRAYFLRWIAKKLHMILTQSFFYLISTLLKLKKNIYIFFFSLSWP